MINFNSFFRFTTSQKRGVLFLIIIIILLQLIYFYVDFSNKNSNSISKELVVFQRQIDSLKKIQKKTDKPIISFFNPNYITDFKGYQIGMSVQEIDRFLEYRKSGNLVNSAKEFQQVTGISDSLLARLQPYFKFSKWTKSSKISVAKSNKLWQESFIKKDINLATMSDLEVVKGVGKVLSKRIIAYRNKLNGFSFNNQLYEVYNLDSLTVKNILSRFEIKQLPKIEKLNINSASFKEILAVPYIDYELTKKIMNYKHKVIVIQSLEELKNIDRFPIEKFDRIALYLQAN